MKNIIERLRQIETRNKGEPFRVVVRVGDIERKLTLNEFSEINEPFSLVRVENATMKDASEFLELITPKTI